MLLGVGLSDPAIGLEPLAGGQQDGSRAVPTLMLITGSDQDPPPHRIHMLLQPVEGAEGRPLHLWLAPLRGSATLEGELMQHGWPDAAKLCELVSQDGPDRPRAELGALLAHELRNLLTPLVNAAQLLGAGQASNEDTTRFLTMLEDQVRHLSRLVDDLQDAPRIAREGFPLRSQRLDLVRLVQQRVALCQPVLDQLDHALTLTMPSVPVVVEADAARLHQVVANLLSNACRYTPRGRGIGVSLQVDEDQAVLRVTDHGIGMAPGLEAVIFEPFTRGVPDSARGGMGIGLNVVKRIVEDHGGTVSAESPGPGQGSTFTVRLPVSSGQPPLAAFPRPDTGAHHRVLLVEDNAVAAMSTRLLLQSWGHEVKVSASPEQAMKLAGEFRPTVVILDVRLPGGDGHDLLKALRGDPASSQAVMVGLSGYKRNREAERKRDVSFDHYLVKPPDPHDLARILSQTDVPARVPGA